MNHLENQYWGTMRANAEDEGFRIRLAAVKEAGFKFGEDGDQWFCVLGCLSESKLAFFSKSAVEVVGKAYETLWRKP